jgi:hypothetical protein
MAGFISESERSGILATFESSFDTWSRNITIFKDPLKTSVSPPSSENLFGFEDQQQDPIFTYTLKSGTYPAIIKYSDIEQNLSENAPLLPEPLIHVYAGHLSIKVKRDCRDFINDGPTERVIVDGRSYLLESDERLQTYAGSEYYIFTLRKTQ